jgi:hypothetical protein
MISEAACLDLSRRSPVFQHSFETKLGEMGLRQVLGHIGSLRPTRIVAHQFHRRPFVWGSVGRALGRTYHVVFMSSRLTKKSSVSVSGLLGEDAVFDRPTLLVTPTRNSGPIPRIPREEPWPAQTR